MHLLLQLIYIQGGLKQRTGVVKKSLRTTDLERPTR